MTAELYLFVDVGSTFTKIVICDAETGAIVATAQARTTIETDVVGGFEAALARVPREVCDRIGCAATSSSAAGGLRIASVGLTQSLSGRAGKLAALGAGGKVVLEAAGRLDAAAINDLAKRKPHIVLLSGGVDGGDSATVIHNARALASLPVVPTTIVAGNRDAAEAAAALLREAAAGVRIADNVFPAPGRVEVASTRSAVVDLFMAHITKANGLDRLTTLLGTDCEPTPLAVSKGMTVVAEVCGPTVLVDVGGATTDVHSTGGRQHIHSGFELEEPDVTRTVEGDIGMRWGAPGIVEAMGDRWCEQIDQERKCDIRAEAALRAECPGFLPTDDRDRTIERTLGQAAIMTALERHAGRVVVRNNPWGNRYRIQGKDLRRNGLVLGTGGIFRHLPGREAVIRAALEEADSSMLPRAARIGFDDDYALFAVGLAASRDMKLAGRLGEAVLRDNTLSVGRIGSAPREHAAR